MLLIHLRLMHVVQKRGGETHPILAKHKGAVSGNCTELMLACCAQRKYLSDVSVLLSPISGSLDRRTP
jgi:hypothetical protein